MAIAERLNGKLYDSLCTLDPARKMLEGADVLRTPKCVADMIKRVSERARDVVGDGPTYISFYADGLDPAFAPGTGTPQTGGLTPREAPQICMASAGLMSSAPMSSR